MRRIAFFLLLIMIMGMAVASSEIRHGIDNFTGGKRYTSGNYLANQEWIGLRKLIDGNIVTYEALFSEEELKNTKFSSNSGEIKIDDNPVDMVVIKDISSNPTINNGISFIRLTALITVEQVERIKNANRVALKFYKVNGNPAVIVLPDTVLAEWKEVIATEK